MRWRRDGAGNQGDAADADGDNGSRDPYFHPDFLGGARRVGRAGAEGHTAARPRVTEAKHCVGMSSHKLAWMEKTSNVNVTPLSSFLLVEEVNNNSFRTSEKLVSTFNFEFERTE